MRSAPEQPAEFSVSLVVVVLLVLLGIGAGVCIGWLAKPPYKRVAATPMSAALTAGSLQPAAATAAAPAPASQPAPAPQPAPMSIEEGSRAFKESIKSVHVQELESDDAALALLKTKAPRVLLVYRADCRPSQLIQSVFNEAAIQGAALNVAFARIETNTTRPQKVSELVKLTHVPHFVGVRVDGTIVTGADAQKTIVRTASGIAAFASSLLTPAPATEPAASQPPVPTPVGAAAAAIAASSPAPPTVAPPPSSQVQATNAPAPSTSTPAPVQAPPPPSGKTAAQDVAAADEENGVDETAEDENAVHAD